jgi:hypothetical protein
MAVLVLSLILLLLRSADDLEHEGQVLFLRRQFFSWVCWHCG